MTLFDELERTDTAPADYGAPHFAYLNRTARQSFANCRALLESWFLDYPDEHKSEFQQRLRSNDDRQFDACCWELLLYRVLRRLGYHVEVHPAVASGTRCPDFLATNGADRVYVEAVVCSGISKPARGKDRRVNDVDNQLDQVPSSNFFLHRRLLAIPSNSVGTVRIRRNIELWLATLDPDQVADEFAKYGLRAIPRQRFESDGLVLDIRAIPKKAEARGKPGARSVGMRSGAPVWPETEDSVRDSIRKKAGRYGKLEAPYLIAVNMINDYANLSDCWEALFGDDHSETDGALLTSRGPTYQRVSGILVGKHAFPWSAPRVALEVFANPFASHPYRGELLSLPLNEVEAGERKSRPGRHVGDLFELPPDWPGRDSVIGRSRGCHTRINPNP